MIDLFADSPWPGVLLWAALFVSDCMLTHTCARMYQGGVRERFRFEGSYEMNPFHQADVDALRRFGTRFFFALALGCAFLYCIWQVTRADKRGPPTYEITLGTLILSQLTIHVRHLRNYFLFRAVLAGRGISGRIEYARAVLLEQSAVELCAFAVLYALVAVITRSWFVLGGAVACAVIAAQHRVPAGRRANPGEASQPARAASDLSPPRGPA